MIMPPSFGKSCHQHIHITHLIIYRSKTTQVRRLFSRIHVYTLDLKQVLRNFPEYTIFRSWLFSFHRNLRISLF